jgi:hypothetical protein
MSNLSNFIVSLWMLPVVICIALPLFILIIHSVNRIARKISGTAKAAVQPTDNIGNRQTGEATS